MISPPCNIFPLVSWATQHQHEEVQLMSTRFALTLEGCVIKAQSSRRWDLSDGLGKWWNRRKEFWVGQRTAPEMPECIFRAAHNTCKPVLTQTPSLPLPLVSLSHLSLSAFSILPHRIWHLGFRRTTQGEQNPQKKKKKQRSRLRGSRSLVLRLVWGKCFVCVCRVCVLKCAHVCCVLCAVCLLHQWGRCCWDCWWCQWPCLAARLYSLLLSLMDGISSWTHSPSSWPFVIVQMLELDATLEKSLDCHTGNTVALSRNVTTFNLRPAAIINIFITIIYQWQCERGRS